jgi:hypothetical protein
MYAAMAGKHGSLTILAKAGAEINLKELKVSDK